MRFSLDSALLILALAHSLVTPVSASGGKEHKRHFIRRATHGFHKSALRHSAGLAQDLRVAFKGLGSSNTPHRPVQARSNLGNNKPYCVSSNGKRQSNSSANWNNPFKHTTSSSASASRSTSTSPTSAPGQSNFKLAQSYVSDPSIWFPHRPRRPVRNAPKKKFADHPGIAFLWFRSLAIRFSRDGTSSLAAIRPMGRSSLLISRRRCVRTCILPLVCTLNLAIDVQQFDFNQ